MSGAYHDRDSSSFKNSFKLHVIGLSFEVYKSFLTQLALKWRAVESGDLEKVSGKGSFYYINRHISGTFSGNRGYEKSDSKKSFKLLKSAHLYSKNTHIQGDPKKFLKKSHHSCNNVIGRIKLPFTAIYSLTSQTLAELNNLSFSI